MRCKANLECFRLKKEAVVRWVARAALDAEMDVELSGKTVEAVNKVAFSVPKAVTVNLL